MTQQQALRMQMTPHEVELKFEFDIAEKRRLQRHIRIASARKRPARETLVSVYFDTADFKLHAEGILLRVRHCGKRYTQTIKVPDARAGSLLDREEWEQDIDRPYPDLAAAKNTLIDRLLNGQLSEPLRPVFETRVQRTTYLLTNRGQRVVVALDEGEIDTWKRCLPLLELELELVRGERDSLFRLAKQLNDVVPLRLCVKAKADRGYELVRNEVDPVDTAADVHLLPDMSTEDAFRFIAGGCLRQLIANEPAMRAGHGEALHQMRVALRRLRAAISAFSNVVADSDWQSIKSELRWITGALGPARDLDVFVVEVLAPLRAQNPKEPGVIGICRDFERRRARAFKEATETVQCKRYRRLVLDTLEWIEVGPWTKDNDDLLRLRREQPVRVHAVDEFARRRRKLRRKGRTLKELTPLERHMLRIAGKKFRYAAEFFADVFPGKTNAKRCKDTLSALKDLQNALGGLNDVAVREKLASHLALSKRFKSDTLATRERAFAAGVIFASQEAHISQLLDAAEAAYTRFLRIKAFWK